MIYAVRYFCFIEESTKATFPSAPVSFVPETAIPLFTAMATRHLMSNEGPSKDK